MLRNLESLKGRRRSVAKWVATNPVLPQGFVGQEINTDKIKVGDGLTHWNDLNYLGNSEVRGSNVTVLMVSGFIDSNHDDSFGSVPTNEGTVLATLTPGDAVFLLSPPGLLDDDHWIETRVYDSDGNLLDGIGQGRATDLWIQLSADGTTLTDNQDGMSGGYSPAIVEGHVVIYTNPPGEGVTPSLPIVVAIYPTT